MEEPAATLRATPGEDSPTLWYCMTKATGRRAATDDAKVMMEWQTAGGTLVKAVPTEREAEEWVFNPPPPPVQGPRVLESPPGLFTPRVHRVNTPQREDTSGGDGQRTILTEMLEKTSRYAVGPDSSTGTSLIFGVDPADVDKMDELLLPPTIVTTKAKRELYATVMDVPSLPGNYRMTDDDESSPFDVLAVAFGGDRATPIRDWRKGTHTNLLRVKSHRELLQTARDVEKIYRRHRKAQEQQMRGYLQGCGLASEVTELYVQSGLLPRLVHDSYRFYLGMLETMRQAQWETQATTWTDSYVDKMIRHHGMELSQIRKTAPSYRMHVLETYVYLRNANKASYHDPSFTHSLMYSLANRGGISGGTTDAGATPGGGASERCKHCRRIGTHTGTEKSNCTLKALSSTKAQKAVAGLDKAQARAVGRKVQDLLAADGAADHDAVIDKARSTV